MHGCMCMPNVTFLEATITAISSILTLFDILYFPTPSPPSYFTKLMFKA